MNKPSLSANTLFHFTNKMENIINILTCDFAPTYCMETFDYLTDENSSLEIALPMICFCDIQLSQIGNHIKNYGGYSIGLSKKWGISKGINPVMYSLPNSLSTQIMKQLIGITNSEILTFNNAEKNCQCSKNKKKPSIIEGLKNSIQEINSSNTLLFNFTNYMKPYEGHPWKENSFSDELIRFYDEREWRFVPDHHLLREKNLPTYLTREQFLADTLKTELNLRLGKVSKLSFSPNDIKYIIVNSENEILNICEQIDFIKGDKYSREQIKLLKTRLISTDQILEDF